MSPDDFSLNARIVSFNLLFQSPFGGSDRKRSGSAVGTVPRTKASDHRAALVNLRESLYERARSRKRVASLDCFKSAQTAPEHRLAWTLVRH
jgi:hypothetical protein